MVRWSSSNSWVQTNSRNMWKPINNVDAAATCFFRDSPPPSSPYFSLLYTHNSEMAYLGLGGKKSGYRENDRGGLSFFALD